MKAGIHPEYKRALITCACGRVTETRSTIGELHVEICSHCHPFFTGRQKLVDTAGRVERFMAKYGMAGEQAKEVAEAAAARAEEAEAAEPEAEDAEPEAEAAEPEAEPAGEPEAELAGEPEAETEEAEAEEAELREGFQAEA